MNCSYDDTMNASNLIKWEQRYVSGQQKDRQSDNTKALNATMHGFNPFPISHDFCCLPSLLLNMYLDGLYCTQYGSLIRVHSVFFYDKI